VAVKKGDVLSVSGTYDTRTTSWYEVMAIMPVAITNVPAGGVDPFLVNTAVPGVLTHGHLPENDHHGGASGRDLSDARRLPDGPRTPTVDISQFIYRQGDLTGAGAAGRPPVVSVGQPLTFVNDDASRNIFHTITACKLPCNRSAGIGYPLANGAGGGFDSGELGFGPTIDMGLYAGGSGSVPITAVVPKPADKAKCKGVPGLVGIIANGCVGTQVYKTPKNLRPGTYSYFCRIHPFMRGAFRVVKKNARS
jgi:plastocyanin